MTTICTCTSLTWPHPLLQRREGVWGLALQPAVTQEFNYLCNPYMMQVLVWDMAPDTIMCESSCGVAIALSISVVLQLMTQLVASKADTPTSMKSESV